MLLLFAIDAFSLTVDSVCSISHEKLYRLCRRTKSHTSETKERFCRCPVNLRRAPWACSTAFFPEIKAERAAASRRSRWGSSRFWRTAHLKERGGLRTCFPAAAPHRTLLPAPCRGVISPVLPPMPVDLEVFSAICSAGDPQAPRRRAEEAASATCCAAGWAASLAAPEPALW